MKPRGPLMIEHRLIEKMIAVIADAIKMVEASQTVDPVLVDTIVDFIRMYADRTHHGKEEDILFSSLEKKKISESDANIMKELIEEHLHGRRLVAELVAAKELYLSGDKNSMSTILNRLRALITFYPEHIKKEDINFFPQTEKYFTPEELDTMLEKFYEFDQKMIHEKYKNVVEQMHQRFGLLSER